MRYGFIIPKGDPRTVAELASEVEAAGWDGAFYWDGLHIGETYSPMLMLSTPTRLFYLPKPTMMRRTCGLTYKGLAT